MNYVYVVKLNISLTHLDMYTSSTEPPPPPGPSSIAGNELLRVVCRLATHTGHNFMHHIFNSYTIYLGGPQNITAQGKKTTEYYVMSCSTPVTSSLAHHIHKHGIWAVICIACSLQLRARIILVFTYSSIPHIACNAYWRV